MHVIKFKYAKLWNKSFGKAKRPVISKSEELPLNICGMLREMTGIGILLFKNDMPCWAFFYGMFGFLIVLDIIIPKVF